ncbi:MAG TPA: hypothetical protein VKB24_06805 [Candidatus Acidoferrum sp.]|nr:hypothetical protein [Candidatus Acidoferrum sp.]
MLVFLLAAGGLAGCAAHFGPGYAVEQQKIQVHFSAEPEPQLAIMAEYRLENTGNQPLDSLDVRLPGRRYRSGSFEVSWDRAPLAHNVSPDNPRDTELRFRELWKIGEVHTLEVSYQLASATGEDTVGFSADAFYLPSEGWIPQLPQARGLFGFGGVPPQQWPLVITVPREFLVHASGEGVKHSAKGSSHEYSFRQTAEGFNPFVIAGRYVETLQTLSGGRKVHLWTRGKLDAAQLAGSGAALSKTVSAYDALFGTGSRSGGLWIVECPSAGGCATQREASYAALLYGRDSPRSAQLISRDSVLVDAQTGAGSIEASAGPALAAGWLGYGQNPGFYEQQPPVSALPAFAAALAREAVSGQAARSGIIERGLLAIPEPAAPSSNADPAVVRAKSLLLFYALRDKVGPDSFEKAIRHMLYARQRRGFNVNDLIAALEEESHQPVGPFVRQWIKRPGIPAEFRSRYAHSAGTQPTFLQETTQ